MVVRNGPKNKISEFAGAVAGSEKISIGEVVAINGQVALVDFFGEKPKVHELLALDDANGDLMEVIGVSQEGHFICFVLSDTFNFWRGAKILRTGRSIEVPTGKGTLGRIMNVFGEPVDKKGEIKSDGKRNNSTI